ncbi:MAG: glycosyltransferase [Ignavibacteriaceae bacterium]|nr:glycosyltransferase [Ignavibacteriaceae bacterium]
MSALFLTLVIIYFLLAVIIQYYISKILSAANEQKSSSKMVSVVIAARDESKNVKSLIDSLSQQNYPNKLFEIIIVDDNSQDSTFLLLNQASEKLSNLRVLQTPRKKYFGKRGALDFGISQANGELILITDADCRPKQNWILSLTNKLENGCEFVFGIAPLESSGSFISRYSCFENLRASILTFSAASAGISYSASARSLGFKKSAFYQLQGYKNTLQSLSGDDDLLLREAVKSKMKIGVVTDSTAFVFSDAKKNFRDYLIQKARHTSASFHYLLSHKVLLSVWHSTNLLLAFSFLLIPISVFFAIPFGVKIFVDAFMNMVYQKNFGYKFRLTEILYFQFIYEIFIVINLINSVMLKPRWK